MKILFIALACLLMQTASAQHFPNIYRDVMALRETMVDSTFKIDDASREIYSPILRRYFDPSGKNPTQEIRALVQKKNNPFRIKNMLENSKSPKNDSIYLPAAPPPILKKLNLIPSETVVAAATGSGAPLITSAITSLVIKRAKQELTVVFFNKLKEELNQQAGLVMLFPKTAALMGQIEPYLYAGFLNTLRAAFAEDINGLVSAVPAYLRLSGMSDENQKDTLRQGQWLSVPVLDALGSLFTGSSLADAIQKLRPDRSDCRTKDWENVYNTLEFLCMLSEAVRDDSDLRNWISVEDFSKNVIENQVNTRLFYGLLYEKIRSFTFTKKDRTTLKLTAVITNEAERISALNNSIRILLQGYNQAASVLDSLQTMGLMAEVSYQKAIGLMTRISSTTKNTCTQITRLIGLADAGYTAKTDSLFKNVTTLTALIGNLYEKQFAAAVMNSTVLLDRYLPSTKQNITRQLVKYGSFAASLIEAKNENDISNALDAAILPTGSSSIKQYTGWSVSINSYIGANWYTEKYKSASVANKTIRFPTFGISLPIGVAFTKGLRNTSIGKVVGAVSLFASILDLGAVASYQLSTPDSITSKQLPDFTWKNLLAPGGFVVLGRLFNTPLSLGFGMQKGPALRSIRYGSGSTSIDLSDQLNWRSGIFLAVDIPFFNLFSKPFNDPERSITSKRL
ncbi:MAG: hypothetical protein HYU71_10785 [Bacteroidetes bacterium]|nr:hypothetical protein [Bacteroidota bacterium]